MLRRLSLSFLLTLLFSKCCLSAEESCRNVVLNDNSGLTFTRRSLAGNNQVEDTPVTRISLTDNCNQGHINWAPLLKQKTHIVQFTKNHEPFAICLHNGATTNELSLTHLKGSSKRALPNLSYSSTIPQGQEEAGKRVECIRSHCNHVTLMIQSNNIPLRSQPHKVSYSLLPDDICSRCSDDCMKTILCQSDYIFIGNIRKVSQEKSTGYKYKNQVYIERYIRYNNTYTLSKLQHCNKPPTQHAVDSDYRIPKSGGLVNVMSKCRLKEGKRYFTGANLKLGYLSKPRLILGCGQEDIDYMLYQFDKLLLQSNTCC